jgi:ABC-type sugar transport system permease subunit
MHFKSADPSARTSTDGNGKAKRKRMTKGERRRMAEDFILLSPQLFLFILLTLVPLVVAIPLLLTDRSNLMDPVVDYIGLENFTRLFEDPDISAAYVPALMRTARFTLLNYMMVYVFGLTLALVMYEVGFRGEFFTIIYLPRMISSLALGYIAVMLFAEATGSLNLLLLELGVIQKPINIKLEQGTTMILPVMMGWQHAGFNMAIFLSGLLSIPQETIEASIVDGAGYFQRLIRVYFPQMASSFIIVTIFCLLGSFSVFGQLIPLGGLYGNPAAEFVSIIFFKYAFGVDRLALGLALTIETFLPLALIGVLLQRLQKRLTYEI